MSKLKGQEKGNDLSYYIKNINDQELKVLLLKLKNEAHKTDATWEQIKEILRSLSNKNNKALTEVIPLLLKI